MSSRSAEGSGGETFLDEIFGTEVDWRELVGRYPKVALGLAAAGGVALGLRHGEALLTALSDALGERTAAALRSVAGGSVAGGVARDDSEEFDTEGYDDAEFDAPEDFDGDSDDDEPDGYGDGV